MLLENIGEKDTDKNRQGEGRERERHTKVNSSAGKDR